MQTKEVILMIAMWLSLEKSVPHCPPTKKRKKEEQIKMKLIVATCYAIFFHTRCVWYTSNDLSLNCK